MLFCARIMWECCVCRTDYWKKDERRGGVIASVPVTILSLRINSCLWCKLTAPDNYYKRNMRFLCVFVLSLFQVDWWSVDCRSKHQRIKSSSPSTTVASFLLRFTWPLSSLRWIYEWCKCEPLPFIKCWSSSLSGVFFLLPSWILCSLHSIL